MLLRPFQHQRHRAAREFSAKNLESPDLDQRFELSIERVKMRWNMIPKIHLNQNSIKPTDRGHFSTCQAAQVVRVFIVLFSEGAAQRRAPAARDGCD